MRGLIERARSWILVIFSGIEIPDWVSGPKINIKVVKALTTTDGFELHSNADIEPIDVGLVNWSRVSGSEI